MCYNNIKAVNDNSIANLFELSIQSVSCQKVLTCSIIENKKKVLYKHRVIHALLKNYDKFI